MKFQTFYLSLRPQERQLLGRWRRILPDLFWRNQLRDDGQTREPDPGQAGRSQGCSDQDSSWKCLGKGSLASRLKLIRLPLFLFYSFVAL